MSARGAIDIVPNARCYYDRMTAATAVEYAQEKIEEWDYAIDPHGYCHERPMLAALVARVTELEAECEACKSEFHKRPGEA